MNEDEPFFNIKEHIKLQTDVQPESQILILNNQDMEEKVGSNTFVKGTITRHFSNAIETVFHTFSISTVVNIMVFFSPISFQRFSTNH